MFKILIAEDDRELRQLFAHVLTKNGYTVLGVSNGEEALAALEQSYYDLIISDIMMPKMDGYELVRSIRESGSSIPIMMITAKDAFDDMRLGFLSGSDDYMVKPINIGEMVLRVSALLRRAQMASERRQVIGGTVMECDSLSVTVDGESMVLPQKEFMLLYKMASFPGHYDLIISDIMMPKMDGYELVRSIRESGSSIPIMMITAKDAFDDMRLGFLSGSDDYMVKPINIGEMVLRVSALLRRAQMASERRQVIGGTVMECDSLSVTVDGESMVLPQKEFMLLYKMASFPGRIFTRQQLMDDIWGYDSSTDTHTVDVHIARLRERFRDNPDFKIVTMRGVGYKVVRT